MRVLSGLLLGACFTLVMAFTASFVVLLRSSLLHLIKPQGGIANRIMAGVTLSLCEYDLMNVMHGTRWKIFAHHLACLRIFLLKLGNARSLLIL